MRSKPKRQTLLAILFWAQSILVALVLTSGTTYALSQVLNLTFVSVVIYPIALRLVLGFRTLVYLGIGLVIIFSFYRRLTRRKKLMDQSLKDRLRQLVFQTGQRMMVKKQVRPFILPGSGAAANTGRNRIVVGENLVQHMDDQQLAGIIGHELAHGMKHHVLIKAILFPIIVVLGIGLYAVGGTDPSGTILVWTTIAGLFLAEIPLSWKMEYGADHLSAELLGRNTMIRALAYLRETHYDGPSFTHPTLTGRINRLATDRNLQDMQFVLPVSPVTQSPSIGEPPQSQVSGKSDQAGVPLHAYNSVKPRFCPICGSRVAAGKGKCGSCGTNLQLWRPRE